VTESPESLAYRESERAIDTQIQAFDELRSRTGLLLAAIAVTASFLGGAALDPENGLGGYGVAALVAFGAGIGACLYILWPRRDAWLFVMSAKVLLEDWRDEDRLDARAMQRFIAEKKEENYDANEDKMRSLYAAFRVGSLAIGVEVILWILELANGG
jgi:hypothetical protein